MYVFRASGRCVDVVHETCIDVLFVGITAVIMKAHVTSTTSHGLTLSRTS
jgi:hypothetical protein